MKAAAEQVQEEIITNEDDINLAARSLKAMAHPLRLKILCILGAGPEASVQDIIDKVGTSQSNVSQHLAILHDKGILVSHKRSNKVYYSIGDPKILILIMSMREAFCSSLKH